MENADLKKRKKEFFESLPESITGVKDDKEYPLKNIQWYGFTFKRESDGTIDIDNIRIAVTSVLKGLYRQGFLTIEPLSVIVGEGTVTNIANETPKLVFMTSYLDNSDH